MFRKTASGWFETDGSAWTVGISHHILLHDLHPTCLDLLFQPERYKVPLSSRWYFLLNQSLSLCFRLIFPLRTSSVLLRSFLQVSIFLLTLLFQNGFSVLLPLLSFILPILSVVTYATACSKEFSFVQWRYVFASFLLPNLPKFYSQLCSITWPEWC